MGTIGWLAFTGYGSNKSYYVTIAELGGMGDKAYHSNLRVEGFVQPGSIEQDGTHVTFVLNEFESHSPKAPTGRLLKVIYKGSEPPPDTFKDDAQALAEGTYGRDGVFHATVLQAKCASKYAPAQPGATPAASQPQPTRAQLPRSAPPTGQPRQPHLQPTDRHDSATHPEARHFHPLRPARSGFQALRLLCRAAPGLRRSGTGPLLRPHRRKRRRQVHAAAHPRRPAAPHPRHRHASSANSDPHEARARIGYMSHAPMLYDELTAQENLRYFASLYPGRACLSPAEALRQVGLDPDLDRPLGQYSQGMRQRTSLARVLLPVPELLLLDEPFSNMDVESARQMVELLAGFRQSNRTIVITTHQREARRPHRRLGPHASTPAASQSFEPGSPTL